MVTFGPFTIVRLHRLPARRLRHPLRLASASKRPHTNSLSMNIRDTHLHTLFSIPPIMIMGRVDSPHYHKTQWIHSHQLLSLQLRVGSLMANTILLQHPQASIRDSSARRLSARRSGRGQRKYRLRHGSEDSRVRRPGQRRAMRPFQKA